MKILFLHGWQSTPGGLKPTYLKDHGHTVLNPALPDNDFDAAVRIAQQEFDQGKPDVVVGSSRGGAVAMEPWNMRPARKSRPVTALLKAEVETKANDLIVNVLKPRYVKPPKRGKQFMILGSCLPDSKRSNGAIREWLPTSSPSAPLRIPSAPPMAKS